VEFGAGTPYCDLSTLGERRHSAEPAERDGHPLSHMMPGRGYEAFPEIPRYNHRPEHPLTDHKKTEGH
jgi:hypothetical protein